VAIHYHLPLRRHHRYRNGSIPGRGSNGIDWCGRRGQPAGLPPFRAVAIHYHLPLRRHHRYRNRNIPGRGSNGIDW